MTISGAAKDLGISRQTAARYVKGEILPDTASLILFCSLIEIPFDALCLPSYEELEKTYRLYSGLTACEKKLLSCYRMISDFQKGYLLEVVMKGCERVEAEYAERIRCKSEEAPAVRRHDSR